MTAATRGEVPTKSSQTTAKRSHSPAQGDIDETAGERLHNLASLNREGREALCDMLLQLQANDALTVAELRANLTARFKLLTGPRYNN